MDKRIRGKNFTINEKEILLNIVRAKQGIIENKKTDAESSKIKNECWEEIAEQFNSSSTHCTRTANQLKIYYENYKAKLKKSIAEKHIEQYLLSNKDKEILLDLIVEQKSKYEIFNNNIWRDISTNFNKSSATERSAQYLYNFYSNYKSSLMKNIQFERRETLQTCGGPFKKPRIDTCNEIFVESLPSKNPYDSDSSASYFNDTDSLIIEEQNDVMENLEIIINEEMGQNITEKEINNGGSSISLKEKRANSRTAEAYESIITESKIKANNIIKESVFEEEKHKIKMELFKTQLHQTQEEHKEKMECLRIEQVIKKYELEIKQVELKIKMRQLEKLSTT